MQRISSAYIPEIIPQNPSLVGRSTMNYGIHRRGTQPSTVAGECVLRFDRRWIRENATRTLSGNTGRHRGPRAEDPSFRRNSGHGGQPHETGMVHEDSSLRPAIDRFVARQGVERLRCPREQRSRGGSSERTAPSSHPSGMDGRGAAIRIWKDPFRGLWTGSIVTGTPGRNTWT
jgi:hypothetical protein